MKQENKSIAVVLLLVVCFILLFVIPVFCQKTNGVTYKTLQTEIFFKEENPWFKGGTLIEFRGNYIITTYKDQMAKIYLDEPWKEGVFTYDDNEEIPDWKHLRAQAHDNSGSSCYLYYGYDPELKAYQLWVVYNNVGFCHWMQPSDELMYDILDEWPEHKMHTEPYTDEQVAKFLKNFGFFLL